MPSAPPAINSIAVIVGLDLIGDALIKLPFVRGLRAAFPDARISWLTAQGKSAYAGPLRELTEPYITEVIEQPDWLPTSAAPETLGEAPRYDLIIDTRGRWREALRARSLPHGLFIAPAFRYLLSDRRPRRFWQQQAHIQDRLNELVRLAAGHLPAIKGGINVPEAASTKAASIMPPGPQYIGLAPGAGNVVKVWPRERFIDLAGIQAKAGRVPVFLLGPQEASWLPELQQLLPSARFPLQNRVWNGQYSMAATLAVGARLACAVTNDSGTSHMLAAVDCPLVSLFGPTDAAKLAPRVSAGRVVAARKFGQREMTAIPVAAVAAAVVELLAAKEPAQNLAATG